MKRGWLATVAGCGILLVLIAAFAYLTERESKHIYAEVSANDRTIQELEVQLNALQTDIYISGIYLRDRLLDPQSADADRQRSRLNEVHDAMEKHFQNIATLMPVEQATHIAELRREIDLYWAFVSPVAENPIPATAQGYDAVRAQLTARHDSSLAIAREIGRINRTTYQERHSRLEAAHVAFLKSIWTMMAIIVGVGSVVFIASGYIVRALSMRSEADRQSKLRVERELRQLSSELFHTQEHERRVLSRELHDEVGQTLTALGMEIGNIEGLHAGPKGAFAGHVQEAKRLTQETLKTVRRLSMGLRPAMLDDSGLVPAVRYQAREFSRHSGIASAVEISGTMDHLPEAYRTCIYRVVQEALTNCARHAQARNVRIILTGDANAVSLRVEDDGVGMKSHENQSGIGLTGIGERVRELHGQVHIDSDLNRGTVLHVDLPLSQSVAS